jgi:predicted permease
MGNILQDLRFALRQFRKSPGFVITAVLSLTLGIGATTAIFSVVYGVLLDPYPYQDADRMVHVELRDKSDRGPLLVVNATGYQQLHQASTIDDVFLQQSRQQVLTGDQLPISVNVGIYSPNLFTYMGVPPLLGREFTPADVPSGSAPIAVLSYLFWHRQYGGSRDVIGKTIELNHSLYTVIGVVPPRFTWGDSEVYVPANPTADPKDFSLAFVKLKPGVKHSAAAAEIQTLVDQYTKDFSNMFRPGTRVTIVTLNEEVLGRFAGTLILLFVAVVALLVIGCANVSILLLARGTARQHELAVRASVGASRTRLIRQLLTESVLLALSGAALGVLAAYRGVEYISAMLPHYSFPHEAAIHVSAIVLVFSAALAVITGILFGISPAWHLSHPELSQLIQAGSSRHSGSARARNTHRLLIAGQVALTLLLMAGAGAAIKSFMARTHTPLGFNPDHVSAMTVALPKGTNAAWEARLNAYEAVRQAIEQTPGVSSASVSVSWFPGLGGFNAKVEVQSEPTLTRAQGVLALVSPHEFATLHIPLLRGRIYNDSENMRAAHVALVNQAFIKQFLGGRDPIGEHVRSPMLKADLPDFLLGPKPDDWLEVIGVVGDALNDGIDHPAKPAIFLPYSFVLTPDEGLLVRSRGDPEAAMRSIKQRLRQVNPDLVVSNDHTLNWWLETVGWGRERFIATLFSFFAILALALAAAGLYSVVSYSVNQRTQEVGIRMALGAQRGNIIRLVISSTATMLGIGMTVGLILSIALNRLVNSWAGASSRDPLTLLGAASLLVGVAALACIFPAWRAASIHPMEALRTE